jgi:hypothetical protein
MMRNDLIKPRRSKLVEAASWSTAVHDTGAFVAHLSIIKTSVISQFLCGSKLIDYYILNDK